MRFFISAARKQRGTPQEYKACLDLQDDLMHRRLALDEHVSENNNTVALLQAEAKELVGKDTLEYNRRCASLVVDLNVRDAVISERSGEAGGLSATASAAPPADK